MYWGGQGWRRGREITEAQKRETRAGNLVSLIQKIPKFTKTELKDKKPET